MCFERRFDGNHLGIRWLCVVRFSSGSVAKYRGDFMLEGRPETVLLKVCPERELEAKVQYMERALGKLWVRGSFSYF